MLLINNITLILMHYYLIGQTSHLTVLHIADFYAFMENLKL